MELGRELLIAFCLMLILEGAIPFLYPQRWQNLVQQLAGMDERTLRIIGLVSMLMGTVLLYVVRS
tara:strand:+ start:418 stop:612 length:195 start_codon:yes stop_codon:yes gene_type:complete